MGEVRLDAGKAPRFGARIAPTDDPGRLLLALMAISRCPRRQLARHWRGSRRYLAKTTTTFPVIRAQLQLITSTFRDRVGHRRKPRLVPGPPWSAPVSNQNGRHSNNLFFLARSRVRYG